jgi:hypothetical protein
MTSPFLEVRRVNPSNRDGAALAPLTATASILWCDLELAASRSRPRG